MLNRIDKIFKTIESASGFALAPFITIGYPDIETSTVKMIVKKFIESEFNLNFVSE